MMRPLRQRLFNMTKNVEVKGSPATIQKQFGFVNLLKAVAAQLIVLHHLAFYGPMTDHARLLVPSVIGWLDQYGRIAVQVFLVIGGFLAAKSLAPHGHFGRAGAGNPLLAAWRRYVKLMPPFMAAMLLAIAASTLARHWMDHESISAPASVAQLGAHALLLHDVLGVEALSAGAWYVAIDFQLYALTSLLLWTCGRVVAMRGAGRPLPWLLPAVVTLGVAASLLVFNRDAGWDVWAPYFFGSYGLGMLAWWASDPARRPGAAAALLAMMVVPTMLALGLDFRSRIAVAMVVACLLILFGRARTVASPDSGWSLVNYVGRISYSIFLVHFPVCLVVNALFTRFVAPQPAVQAFGAVLAWAASVAAGAAFCRWVEQPLYRALAGSVRVPVPVVPAFQAKPARVR
jgi:peptidoglycan/LPS O-acetylase OafA/YrhL